MKRTFVTLALITATTVSVFAGPFRSVIIDGNSATNSELELIVPAGKAIAIVNFLDSVIDAGDARPTRINVIIGRKTATVLDATQRYELSTHKDIVIDGPATLQINGDSGQFAFLSYRLFAN